MVEIPDRLECLFSAPIDQHGDSYSIEIPRAALEEGAVRSGETYRVAVLSKSPQTGDTATRQQNRSAPSGAAERAPQTPIRERSAGFCAGDFPQRPIFQLRAVAIG